MRTVSCEILSKYGAQGRSHVVDVNCLRLVQQPQFSFCSSDTLRSIIMIRLSDYTKLIIRTMRSLLI